MPAHGVGFPLAIYDLKLEAFDAQMPFPTLVCPVSDWGSGFLNPAVHLYPQLVLWSELVQGGELCCVSQTLLWLIYQTAPSKHFIMSVFGLEIWTGSQAV